MINPIEHTLGEGKGTPKMCFSSGQMLLNAVLTIGEALEAIAECRGGSNVQYIACYHLEA